PLDTAYPNTRLEQMIHAADIGIIITGGKEEKDYTSSVRPGKKEITFIKPDHMSTDGDTCSLPQSYEPRYTPDDKVYIYFTSGTTGKPKAVLGKNKGLLHFINWEIKTFGVNETYRFSQFTNPGFDVFLRDIFVPICAGGTICIPENKEIILSGPHLLEWIDTNGINLIH
ncbi:MAG: AMP-binding protein, partial [bacterium]|nr:AMP-binding protein [bacterium]